MARPWYVFSRSNIGDFNSLSFVSAHGSRERARAKAQWLVVDRENVHTRAVRADVAWYGDGPDPRSLDEQDEDTFLRAGYNRSGRMS